MPNSACPDYAIFDLDGTVTRSDTFIMFLMFVFIRRPSRWLRIFHLVFAALLFFLHIRSNSWLKEYYLCHVVGGLHQSTINRYAARFNQFVLSRLVRADAAAKIELFRKDGARLVLATASPTIYVKDLAASLGISEVIATECEVDKGGLITGRIRGSNCQGAEKVRKLLEQLPQLKPGSAAADQRIAAYSDHLSDFPLLELASDAVVVCPSPKLRTRAIAAGFRVEDWS